MCGWTLQSDFREEAGAVSTIFHIFILAFVLKTIFESTNPVIRFFTGVLGVYVGIKLALWFFESVSALFWIFLIAFSLIGGVIYCVTHDWKLPSR